MTSFTDYWDQRARDFASRGAGLRAVCSYGMPAFYNGYIHLTQELALMRHLRVDATMRVLDIGCGIGRWSRRLARRGATVRGVDLAPSMILEARRRTVAADLDDRIEYSVEDVRTLSLGTTFDRVFAVTVLQHILDEEGFRAAARNVAKHLAAGGRAVLLEAAPTHLDPSCDTHVFRARRASDYCDAFREAGLRIVSISGVDPAPFKTRVLPHYRKLPRLAAQSLMLGAVALSLPVDALFGRALVTQSWHKVFVLEHDG